MLPGKSVISGRKTGFLVLTLPVGFLPVYLFFPGVIVIFDLCQFLLGTGLHAVYLFLPVFSLQGGKILRQPTLCGKPLLGFRFRILPGLLGVDMPTDISFFGCFCGFLYLFLRFFQITVTFVFGIFQQYVISFLIMFLNGSLCVIELPGFCHA